MAHETHDAAHGHHDHPTGWRRFAYSTNHKDIGTMYLIYAVVAGIIGLAMSILFRMELAEPGDHRWLELELLKQELEGA